MLKNMQNESHHPISLWVVAFGLCSALQVFRGSLMDEVIFISSTLLILLSTTYLRNVSFPSARFTKLLYLEWVGAVLLLTLGFIPRHSWISATILVAALLIVVPLSWGETASTGVKLPKRERNSRMLWSSWAIVTCLWEFAANILGQLNETHTEYPTISLLLDPVLNSLIGKAAFVVAWLMVGFGLLRAGRKE
ncbi:MAG: hypothetical protein RL508_205 [Actinomycetota bacterium]|jgi:hypothetical protein